MAWWSTRLRRGAPLLPSLHNSQHSDGRDALIHLHPPAGEQWNGYRTPVGLPLERDVLLDNTGLVFAMLESRDGRGS